MVSRRILLHKKWRDVVFPIEWLDKKWSEENKEVLTDVPILSFKTRSSSTRLWMTSFTDWLMTPFFGPIFSSSLSYFIFANYFRKERKEKKTIEIPILGNHELWMIQKGLVMILALYKSSILWLFLFCVNEYIYFNYYGINGEALLKKIDNPPLLSQLSKRKGVSEDQ